MKEIRALKEKIKMKEEEWLEKDNACKDLQGKLNEFGDIIKESDRTIEEYKSDNEDLRQKIQKVIRTIQSKEEELEEKETEIETAYEEIEELNDKMKKAERELNAFKNKNKVFRMYRSRKEGAYKK